MFFPETNIFSFHQSFNGYQFDLTKRVERLGIVEASGMTKVD